MKFTATWHPQARDDLARIWLEAPDRQAVSDAANRIDRELSRVPETKGQAFFGDRIYVSAPLAVTFAVLSDDRLVQVLQVWHC